MRRKKYNLSPEGIEKLMNRLDEITQKALESPEETSEYLLEAEITTDFIKTLTKVKGIEDVIDRNDQLTKTYQGIISMYGFTSMYDLYMYAMSCDDIGKLVKAKDYSKLVPVKRKIMRNGKEHEVTVWEKPDGKEDPEDRESSNQQEKVTTSKRRHARELKKEKVKSASNLNPKELANIKNVASKLQSGNNTFQDDSDYYLIIKDGNNIVGIVGYKEDGSFLTIDFYRSNGEVSGVATTGFFEMLILASKEGKGIKMPDTPEARPLFSSVGMQNPDGVEWYLDKEGVQDAVPK